MIDGNTIFGRAVLVFFWCGLAASFVQMLYTFWHFNPLYIAWFVVLANILFVTIKNIVIPPGVKK